MVQSKLNLRILILLLIVILILTTLCYGSDDKNESTKNKNPPPDVELDKLYLGKSYLLPDPPGSAPANKTELPAMNHSTFTHNIRDRKFNDKLKPELRLWVNTQGTKGIRLEFEIGFQAVEDNTIIPNKRFKILFSNYTTQGTIEPEYINLTFLKFDGAPFDINPGVENWCSVYLTIRRTDDMTNSKLYIFTGAEGKISYIIIPYDRTLSSYEHEKEDESENTPGFGLELVGTAIIISSIIYFYTRNYKIIN